MKRSLFLSFGPAIVSLQLLMLTTHRTVVMNPRWAGEMGTDPAEFSFTLLGAGEASGGKRPAAIVWPIISEQGWEVGAAQVGPGHGEQFIVWCCCY